MTDTMRIWNAVSKTDPANTKRVNQRGGFTAISAQSQIMEATRQFGPIGEGWGYDAGEPIFKDNLAFVPVTLWHTAKDPNDVFKHTFGPMFGGAEWISTKGHLDSDALKKATTDAITKLLSQLGFNADVFLGLFDDNKYVEQVRREFSDEQSSGPAPRTVLNGPHTSKTALKNAIHAIRSEVAKAASEAEIDDIMRKGKDTVKQAHRDWPELLDGDPNIGEDDGLRGYVAMRREDFRLADSDDSLASFLEDMTQNQTGTSLAAWVASQEAYIESLNDADRRRFELAYNNHESAIHLVGTVHV